MKIPDMAAECAMGKTIQENHQGLSTGVEQTHLSNNTHLQVCTCALGTLHSDDTALFQYQN